MRGPAQTRASAPEEIEEVAGGQSAPHVPLAVWVNDGQVCVTIVDLPPHDALDGSCRCGGCHASLQADWAARFF